MNNARHFSIPACNDGPCGQGDYPCPTPEACQIPLSEPLTASESSWFWSTLAIAVIGAAFLALWACGVIP